MSPPINNKANRELIALLAEYYGVKKSAIRILRGEKNRDKYIEVLGK